MEGVIKIGEAARFKKLGAFERKWAHSFS